MAMERRMRVRGRAAEASAVGLSEIWASPQGVALLLGDARNGAAAAVGMLASKGFEVTHVICVGSSRNGRNERRRSSTGGVSMSSFHMEDRLRVDAEINLAERLSGPFDAVELAMSEAAGTRRRRSSLCGGRRGSRGSVSGAELVPCPLRRAVLVHCDMGVNRSPTLVLSVLMRQGFTLREAYCHVLRARPFIDPLPPYREGLRTLEMELYSRTTVSPNEPFALHITQLLLLFEKPPPSDHESSAASESEASRSDLESCVSSEDDEDSPAHRLDKASTLREDAIKALLNEPPEMYSKALAA